MYPGSLNRPLANRLSSLEVILRIAVKASLEIAKIALDKVLRFAEKDRCGCEAGLHCCEVHLQMRASHQDNRAIKLAGVAHIGA